METNPRGSSPSIYLSPPPGGEKGQFIEKQGKDGVEPRHREIEFLSRNLWGKNLQVSFSIFILYTQHKLCKTTILKGLKK